MGGKAAFNFNGCKSTSLSKNTSDHKISFPHQYETKKEWVATLHNPTEYSIPLI